MKSQIERVLVVNDFHCGSTFGMLPPDMVDAEGHPVMQVGGQQHLWNGYLAGIEQLKPTPPDHIVVCGDMMDGEQYKTNRDTLCLHRRADQREAAYKCLLLLQKAFPKAHWEFVTGTRYHEVRDEVEILARNLSGVKRSVHRNFKLEANGALLEFSHEIPAGGDLKGNTIEREIVRAHTAASEHSREVPDIIVRAHLHIYRQMQRKRIIGVVAPCMELQTDFMDRKSTTAMIPDLGMLLLTIDSARRQRGLNPVVVDYIEVEEPSEKIMMVTHAAATGNAEQRKEKRASWRPSKLVSPPPASRRASPKFEANKNHQARPAKRRVAKFSPSK